MADNILLTLDKYNIDLNKICSQEYDGAGAMSDKFNYIRAIIYEEYSTAIYLHCMSYSLNLAISGIVEIPSTQ